MDLEKQVTSLEISQRLKELGVSQYESHLTWHADQPEVTGYCVVLNNQRTCGKGFAAYSVAELGEMLPTHLDGRKIESSKERNFVLKLWNTRTQKCEFHSYAVLEADARGKMLVYLLENKLI